MLGVDVGDELDELAVVVPHAMRLVHYHARPLDFSEGAPVLQ